MFSRNGLQGLLRPLWIYGEVVGIDFVEDMIKGVKLRVSRDGYQKKVNWVFNLIGERVLLTVGIK